LEANDFSKTNSLQQYTATSLGRDATLPLKSFEVSPCCLASYPVVLRCFVLLLLELSLLVDIRPEELLLGFVDSHVLCLALVLVGYAVVVGIDAVHQNQEPVGIGWGWLLCPKGG